MKIKFFSLLLSLLICTNISEAQKKQIESLRSFRIEKDFNSQWTFNYFSSESAGKGYELPGYNDSKWPAISLPHTWNSYETTGELHPFTRSPGEIGETFWWTGWGWYRKHFSISSEYSDRKVFIEFEGVQKYCKVWVNGKYAGEHKGGYGSFDFDITSLIIPDKDNLIAVAVNFLQKDEFRIHPLNDGKSNVSCGIYRDVNLIITNKLFIPMQGAAGHEGGSFVSTPVISEKEAIVNIKTWVKNDYPQSRTCLLQTSISDKNNQLIQVIKTEAALDAGQLFMFMQTSKPVKNPRLWSVEDPYMYTVLSEVIENKEVVDSNSTSLGFRWFRSGDSDNSVYLNDKLIELKGVNRHQEYPWLGDAVPDWITENDYTGISETGKNNFVRTIDYPVDEFSYQLTDKYGILALEDFSAIADHGFSADEQKQQLIEMIRRDRNHPSIISWGTGDKPVDSANRIVAETEDSTRLVKVMPAAEDTVPAYFVYNKVLNSSGSIAVRSGDPARIIVTASHHRIEAERSSVVIVMADIADGGGNHIPGAKNVLRWKVNGPAKLVGPAYFVSYADSVRNSSEGRYIETPTTNIIRSNGVAGKIKVTVFSSGLASGSCEIEAEEPIPEMPAVTSAKLEEEGRKPVTRNALVAERLEEIPREISLVAEDFRFTPADQKVYAAKLTDYIIKNNPSADTSSVEYKTLADLIAFQLVNNEGKLSADDYNFNINHYNTCRLISGYISKTKLPPLFKEKLRRHYSNQIIAKGIEKNAGDEMNWLNWIPSGGVVVIIPNETTGTGQKGVIYTKKTDLSEIIKVVYPQFSGFSEEARDRALIFISKMNPAIHVKYLNANGINDGTGQNTSATYTTEKGQPILIPEYKFISE